MCGRYHFGFEALEEIKNMAEGEEWKLELGIGDRDIHPGDMAPVITAGNSAGALTGTGVLRLRRQLWGFPAPEGKGLIFNARSESVFEKQMFRESIRLRRAVIPGTWFYEWNKSREKYTFKRKKSRVLFLAGFYNLYEDGEHFVVLTTQANTSMIPVHDRMPVVLEREDVKDWIFNEEKAREILQKVPADLEKSCDYEQLSLFC